jgi:hypothetical protein
MTTVLRHLARQPHSALAIEAYCKFRGLVATGWLPNPKYAQAFSSHALRPSPLKRQKQ